MSTEQEIVATFLERFGAGDYDAAFDLMADDGTWTIPGRSPFAGTQSRDEVKESILGFMALMPDGFGIEPTDWTVEGARVAVEAVGRGQVDNGKTYANQYHFLFQVEGGKIQAVKEYVCTFHAWDVFRDYVDVGQS